ncbi:MAG: sulfite exporter TauE/SafE family protein [Thermoplasmata archaeon]
MIILQSIFSIISGILVGFSLGLIGGGGSILAIPLLIYFVGYHHPHLAIGTTALAVGVNAYLNLIPHALKKNVKYREGIVFTIPGIAGVLAGSELGLLTPGNFLLFFFGLLMIGIAAYMLLHKSGQSGSAKIELSYRKLIPVGLAVGFASGYFGIGGGFLIVPGLLFGGGLNITQAIGTSLISVGTFGVTTAIRYALNGELNILLSVLFILGGVAGGWGGARIANRLPKKILTEVFAAIVIAVAIYIIIENWSVVTHF